MNLKEILKYLKLHESVISMFLGVFVFLVAGVVFINYFANINRQRQITQIGDEGAGVITHVVQKGESLSSIAQKYYQSDNWQVIAQENNIENPNNIKEGQTLIIPTLMPSPGEIAQATISPEPTVKPEETSTPTPTVFTENGEGATSTEAITHVVKEGETLWSIAENYFLSGYNWVDVAEVNGLKNPGEIEVGQSLFIPNVPAKKATVTEVAQTNPITGATYTVVKGDNLWNIAVRAYGDGFMWVDIAKENELENPGLIYAGNTLTLPR